MHYIDIYAGGRAEKSIQQKGFTPELFKAFLGASGGPKWFILAGLDQVIFPHFFSKSTHKIDVIGSSAGAFRAACLTQSDPKAAILRLANRYSSTVYSEKPTSREITQKGYELLLHMMGDNGVHEVLNNERFNAHFFVAKCHGLVSSEKRSSQLAGLMVAGTRNLVSRQRLQKSFTRTVFSTRPKHDLFVDPDKFPTEFCHLSETNLLDSLMASGSIPLILDGVTKIQGAAPGMYRDGGIIDYHFDLRLAQDGLVLFPHFYPTPTPGWFDKGLKNRNCKPSSYDNVLMICPSAEFVRSLPYQKIPDRKDFEEMPADQRIAYWQTVIDKSQKMGDEFLKLIDSGEIVSRIKPIQLSRK